MTQRITFRSEIYISGNDMDEIMSKFENMNLFSDEAIANNAEFIEINSNEEQ